MKVAKAQPKFPIVSTVVCGLLIGLAGFLLGYPVLAERLSTRYEAVLQRHAFGLLPQREKQRPFLYVSWFHHGDLHYGESYAAYDTGLEMRQRFLSRATQGGGGLSPDPSAFHTLQTLPPLPPGLPGPDAIPHGRLLIVTQRQNGGWHTTYYDRENLPSPVSEVARFVRVE